MLLTLTDHLTCPRCGPATGLILLMEEAEERRVRSGALGCPACRTRYPVSGRVADLRGDDSRSAAGPGERAPGASARAGAPGGAGMTDLAVRLAALAGLGEGRGFVLLDGPLAFEVALELSGMLPDYEMVVPIREARVADAAGASVSALLVGGRLPIGSRTMRAAAYVGGAPSEERLLELVRVCRPTGRLVVDLGSDDATASRLDGVAELLAGAGLEVRARDESGLVSVVL